MYFQVILQGYDTITNR